MSEVFESMKKGLEEAIAFSKGDCTEAIVHKVTALDVKNIRAKIGMSQRQFANTFGFSVSAVRHWERGDRTPRGPSLVLLRLIEKAPELIQKTISA